MIKLSVVMMTYNHEKFIEEAINAVINQKTNFDFELIIANDCSTDKTSAIIESINNSNDSLEIIHLDRRKNLGPNSNFIDAYKCVRGEYVALCEGDDYWTDPLKLQKQVDFLENNQDYELCFTNINVIDESGKIILEKLIKNIRKTSFSHQDMPIWSPTLTRVFKNRNFQELNTNVPGMDTFMLIYQSTMGKIKFLDEITGTYRRHSGGIYSGLQDIRKIDHHIQTYMGCLLIVRKEVTLKFTALVLKSLLDLKKIDRKLYLERKNQFLSRKVYFKKLNFLEKARFTFCVKIIDIPFIENSKQTSNFARRVINKFLVY